MKYVAAVLLGACVLLLFGNCRSGGLFGGEGSSSAGGKGFNSTDVMFLQMLVPHHGQGIEIAQMTGKTTVRPAVKTLATTIETTQTAEIKTMAGWLRDWHRPPIAKSHEHADHDAMPMTSKIVLAGLGRATGPRFERDFLNTMIAHQDDAVQVARMEIARGINPKVVALAREIERSRSTQIDQMLILLGQKPTPN